MNARLQRDAEEVAVYKQRFHNTMAFVKKVFPYGFRRSATGKDTPRTRFEAIAIGSYLALHQKASLARRRPSVVDWLTSEEFSDVIGSDGANVTSRLRGRIGFVRDKLVGG